MLRNKNYNDKNSQLNQSKNYVLTVCTILGLLFILIIFGVKNLDPLNSDWVRFGGGDNFQHYIGWRFFRESPWTKHFLFLQNLNYPQGTSVIVTDSNPLLCVFFKLFKSILPAEFQFNGLWIFLNYGLIGFFSGLIGWKMSKNVFFTIILSLFSIFNPVVLQRTAIHDTLTAHWLVLYSIYSAVNWRSSHNWIGWAAIVILGMMIHVYFIPMVGFILMLQMIWMINNKQKWVKIILPLISFSISFIGMYYFAGYNYILPQSSTYGELSMNLNSFINPDGTSILLNDRVTFPLQYEGYNYLGLGFILLIIITAVFIRKSDFRRLIIFTVPCLLYLLLSLSNVITWDQKIMFEIPLPEKWKEILSIFRSSGRLAWPFFYLLLFTSGRIIYGRLRERNREEKLLWCVLIICMSLQFVDLSGFMKSYRDRFHEIDTAAKTLNTELLTELSASVTNLAVADGESKIIDQFALFAAENGLTFNRSANARDIEPIFGEINESVREMIENQTLRKNTIYILLNLEDQVTASEKYPDSLQKTEDYAYLIIK